MNASDLEGLSGVKEVMTIENCKFRVIAQPGVDLRPELFRFAADKNLSLIGLKQEENSLENIFRQLTLQNDDIQH